MPGPDYARTAQDLMESGVDADIPCVVVSKAGRNDEEIRRMRLSEIAAAQGISAPAILIVGEVAAQHPTQEYEKTQPPAIDGTSVISSPSLNL